MKQKLCLLVLALASWQCGWACFIFSDLPENYKYYNVAEYRENPVFPRPSYTHDNLVGWQKYTGQDIPLDQIAKVVYKFSITDMQQCKQDPSIKMCQENAFAKYIFAQKDDYAVRVLLLAKQIEQARSVSNDPWYYPTKKGEDAFGHLLSDVEAMLREVKGHVQERFLTERLQLQHIRVLFAQGEYEACLHLWKTDIEHWDEKSLMRRMIKDYIAGAYAHTGDMETAYRYFWEQGNYNEMAELARTRGEGFVDYVRHMYDLNPDCAELVAPALQNELVELGQYYPYKRPDSVVYEQYNSLMQYILQTHRSKDMSLWYYTSAYLNDKGGDPQTAAKHIYAAATYKTSPMMQNNIRMMRIYLDAKTKEYTPKYLEQLLEDLKWMEEQVIADTARVKKNMRYAGELEWNIRHNRSCDWYDKQYICYPYLMLRKTILGEVVPRLYEAGETTLSIALTNYADNMLFTLVNPEARHVFYSDFFMALDTIPAASVEQYAKSALNPQTELEKFLVKKSYVDKDYLYDIVGTLYIRERNYAKAVEVLSKVNPSYQKRLNTTDNLKKDPFAPEQAKNLPDRPNSKLNFANQMHRLQVMMENSSIDPNRRADAMLDYAVGMRHSYSTVWALTQYGQGYPCFTAVYQAWMTNARWNKIEKDYEQLVERALSLYTDDEAIAAAYLRYKNNYTVVTKYPNTAAAEYVRGHCDTYGDYFPIKDKLKREE